MVDDDILTVTYCPLSAREILCKGSLVYKENTLNNAVFYFDIGHCLNVFLKIHQPAFEQKSVCSVIPPTWQLWQPLFCSLTL